MELKKAKGINEDGSRTTWFLLGLVFALSLLFVVLEYTASDYVQFDDEALLEDMSLDADIYPTIDMSSYKKVVASAGDKRSRDKIKVVDEQPVAAPESDVAATADAATEEVDGADGTDAEPTTDVEPQSDAATDAPLSFRVVEQIPQFPGGMEAFVKWLTTHLKYPPAAKSRKIEGRVVVSFIINTDGTISDAKVVKSVDPMLDREAMRVVGLMPKWTPGVENDKPCRTLFAIPIVFKI